MHPRTFAIAVSGAAVFATMTVASAWAIERATDDVIVPYFEDGHVAAGTVAVTLLTVVAIGIAKSAGVVASVWAGKTQMQVAATLRSRVRGSAPGQRYRWYQALHRRSRRAGGGRRRRRRRGDGARALQHWHAADDRDLRHLARDHRSRPRGARPALFPVLIGLNIVYQRQVNQPATEAQDRLGEVSSVVHESFDGVLVVKALAQSRRR